MSWLTFVTRPKWSYRLNADSKITPSTSTPSWSPNIPSGKVAFVSQFTADYGNYESLADVFRQIGHDERVHKQESETQLTQPRFH
ncbi:MAG: hypothetical protein ACR2ND_10595 [Solirubrobacteraceae bacterium]